MKSYLIPFVLVLALALAACQSSPPEEAVSAAPTQAEDEAAIDELDEASVSAYNALDAAAIAEFCTEDVVQMTAGKPTSVGKEAVQSEYQSFFDQVTAESTIEFTMSREELEIAGDWAFVRGTFAVKRTPKAGGEPTGGRPARYLGIYQRQPDGSWKYARGMTNGSGPLPGATQE